MLTYLSSIGGFTLLRIIDVMYPSVYDKLSFMYAFACMWVRQWLQSNVKKTGDHSYQLTHVIEGQMVKIMLTRTKIVDVQDFETGESFMHRGVEPYLRFKQVQWVPPKKVTFYYEDGTASDSFPE